MKNPSKDAYDDAAAKKIVEFRSVDMADPDQWVYQLNDGNPLYTHIRVPTDMCGGYASSLYSNEAPVYIASGTHAVVILGYYSHYPHKDKGVKSFKIRNSWDVTWGENGYTWIPADTLKKMLVERPLAIKGWKKGKQEDKPAGDNSAKPGSLADFARAERKVIAAELGKLQIAYERIGRREPEAVVESVQDLNSLSQTLAALNRRMESEYAGLAEKEPAALAAGKSIHQVLVVLSRSIMKFNKEYFPKLKDFESQTDKMKDKEKADYFRGLIQELLERIKEIAAELSRLNGLLESLG